MSGFEAGATLADALEADPRVAAHHSKDQIQELLDVERALGSASAFVDRVAEELR
jgi:hypothetical protein